MAADVKKEAFEKELKELLKKHNRSLLARIMFPQYNILPDHVKLALKVLEKEQAQYSIESYSIAPQS